LSLQRLAAICALQFAGAIARPQLQFLIAVSGDFRDNLSSTARYTQVATHTIRATQSPLD
jgi:hypothetical protein